jgi:hypothetical protein
LAIGIVFIAGCWHPYPYREPGDPLKNLEKQSGLALPSSVTVVEHGTDVIDPEFEPYWWSLYSKDALDIDKRVGDTSPLYRSTEDELRGQDRLFRVAWPKMPPILSAKFSCWRNGWYKFNAWEARAADGCYVRVQRVRQDYYQEPTTLPGVPQTGR